MLLDENADILARSKVSRSKSTDSKDRELVRESGFLPRGGGGSLPPPPETFAPPKFGPETIEKLA